MNALMHSLLLLGSVDGKMFIATPTHRKDRILSNRVRFCA